MLGVLDARHHIAQGRRLGIDNEVRNRRLRARQVDGDRRGQGPGLLVSVRGRPAPGVGDRRPQHVREELRFRGQPGHEGRHPLQPRRVPRVDRFQHRCDRGQPFWSNTFNGFTHRILGRVEREPELVDHRQLGSHYPQRAWAVSVVVDSHAARRQRLYPEELAERRVQRVQGPVGGQCLGIPVRPMLQHGAGIRPVAIGMRVQVADAVTGSTPPHGQPLEPIARFRVRDIRRRDIRRDRGFDPGFRPSRLSSR